ncbi:WhiB family transcriptional regulator [Leifsonia sp. Root227]|uniref:WhiB family transcriptional regulator n=1 Tax=Leifsonia sp. Root227 TaxID=1736496 RepID=UPI0009E9DC8B|nr:WhiB family transcriptional regulator [Leifsonia sp. Root227]
MKTALDLLVRDETNWEEHAACKNRDTELFFQPLGTSETEKAKRVCATCPVKRQCLTDALQYSDSEDFGVLGGLDEKQRSRLRRAGAA